MSGARGIQPQLMQNRQGNLELRQPEKLQSSSVPWPICSGQPEQTLQIAVSKIKAIVTSGPGLTNLVTPMQAPQKLAVATWCDMACLTLKSCASDSSSWF